MKYYIVTTKSDSSPDILTRVFTKDTDLTPFILSLGSAISFRLVQTLEIASHEKIISLHSLKIAMGSLEADKPWDGEDERTLQHLWKAV